MKYTNVWKKHTNTHRSVMCNDRDGLPKRLPIKQLDQKVRSSAKLGSF